MRLSLIFLLLWSVLSTGMGQNLSFNSPFDEQAPFLSPDQSTLFFTLVGHPQNSGAKRDPGDIWFSVRGPEGWSRPEPLVNVNNLGYNAVVGMSTDGKELYLYGHYQADGSTASTQGISISTYMAGVWSRPENIYIPYFVNRSTGTGGRLSKDGKVFIYSATTPTSYGAEDIYLTIESEDGWTEPIHLGREINGDFQDLSPSLSDDGKKLYFSSNRPGTKGSYDVFVADRMDDSWRNWSQAKPLVGSLNSDGRELFYSTNGDWILYTSTKDSDGYGDVRITGVLDTIPFVAPIVVADEAAPAPLQAEIIREEKQGEIRPARGLIRLEGLVVSALEKTPLPASILIKGPFENSVIADSNGRFSFEVPDDQKILLEADYKGFISKSEKIDLTKAKRQILELKIVLQPALVGTVVTLSNVLFHQSSASLLAESFDELDVVASFLKLNPEIKIELTGHTDNRGDRSLNLRLSNERVKKVKGYLVTKGIEASRIQGRGYGGSKPIADNRTEEGRKQNRRVEFKIIK